MTFEVRKRHEPKNHIWSSVRSGECVVEPDNSSAWVPIQLADNESNTPYRGWLKLSRLEGVQPRAYTDEKPIFGMLAKLEPLKVTLITADEEAV